MRLKPVLRYSSRERVLRLARLTWERGVVGDGRGYSAKLSVALRPALFGCRREFGGWTLTLLGVRVHFTRAWGGRLA